MSGIMQTNIGPVAGPSSRCQLGSAVRANQTRSVANMRSKIRCNAQETSDDTTAIAQEIANLEDPESKFKRYGKYFGQTYTIQDVVDTAPRVRVRRAHDRARDQLADLAVLNERLAGTPESEATIARKRLEYLKRRRRNWEMVYKYVTKADVECTLGAIEDAAKRVEDTLSDEARDGQSVTELSEQLIELQVDVQAAQDRLKMTQEKVETNLQRLRELQEEAVKLERLQRTTSSATATTSTTTLERSVDRRPNANSNSETGMSLSSKMQRRRGLQSSLELEENLKNHWFAVHFSSKLEKDTMIPFDLFEEPWVLFRDASGKASCIRDECAHRACPLSVGKIVDGEISCAYHGWRFDGEGNCTTMPSTAFCKGVHVASLPCEEADGFVWVWPGAEEHITPLPVGVTAPPPGYDIHAEIEIEVPVEHGLLIENLLDLAHAPFTHTSTFAKGWPVPDVVKFHALQMLSGQWDPYPIAMGFEPPCMTVSKIGLAQPGKIMRGVSADECKNHLHQLHVCLPAKKGHTRLLYRMSMDFLGWTRYLPGIQSLWKSVAGQVLGEDLVLVVGQQDRLLRGGDTWSHPVSYDKLGVRYRRWRNAIANDGELAAAAKGKLSMNAGELFSLDTLDEED